eukprot:7422314-Pyramimonas_sp.AAC.3
MGCPLQIDCNARDTPTEHIILTEHRRVTNMHEVEPSFQPLFSTCHRLGRHRRDLLWSVRISTDVVLP